MFVKQSADTQETESQRDFEQNLKEVMNENHEHHHQHNHQHNHHVMFMVVLIKDLDFLDYVFSYI